MENEEHERPRKTEKIRIDKDDRETCEHVMDKKTRIILFKLLCQGLLSDLQGSVSTGKEASVYLGMASPDLRSKLTGKKRRAGEEGLPEQKPLAQPEPCTVPVAIKIYKTSTMVFKDRERYILGERRFRRMSKGNSRKLIKIWAEKEVRNLHRLQAAGIPSPCPMFLRGSVLIMTLVGTAEHVAPKLKDADIPDGEVEGVYTQCVELLRRMYQECSLVHADFSEYNLLFWENTVHVIDVSQSVEKSHPNALEFLEMDVRNITDFFRRKGADTYSERALLELVAKEDLERIRNTRMLEGSGVPDSISLEEESGETESEEASSSDQMSVEEEGDGAGGEDARRAVEALGSSLSGVQLKGRKEQKKEHKKRAKEEAREKRSRKISKKDKKKLGKKIVLAKKSQKRK